MQLSGTRRKATRWRWFGAAAGLLLLAWVLRDLDLDRLLAVLAGADYRPLLVLPVVAVAEQLIRAVKWQQMLHPLRPIGIGRLFGAIMAGYFANLVIPVRVSPLVRAWLIARLENMRVGTILATVALDRLIDGLVFIIFAAAAVVFVRFPDETGRVEMGLLWGSALSLVVFAGLILCLIALKRGVGTRFAARLLRWLPARLATPIAEFVRFFRVGIVFPAEARRRFVILLASVAMKFVAVTWFLWAGLAFGVVLTPMDYVFLMVFLGFLAILTGALGLLGGFTAGAVFALGGFGIAVETGLAMALVVQATMMLTFAVIGLGALWIQGLRLGDLLRGRAGDDTGAGAEARNDVSSDG